MCSYEEKQQIDSLKSSIERFNYYYKQRVAINKIPFEFKNHFVMSYDSIQYEIIYTDSMAIVEYHLDEVYDPYIICSDVPVELQWLLVNTPLWDSIENMRGVVQYYRDNIERPSVRSSGNSIRGLTIVDQLPSISPPDYNSINYNIDVRQIIRLPLFDIYENTAKLSIYVDRYAYSNVEIFKDLAKEVYERQVQTAILNSKLFKDYMFHSKFGPRVQEIAKKIEYRNSQHSSLYQDEEYSYLATISDTESLLKDIKQDSQDYAATTLQSWLSIEQDLLQNGSLLWYFDSNIDFFYQWILINALLLVISIIMCIFSWYSSLNFTTFWNYYYLSVTFLNAWAFNERLPEFYSFFELALVGLLNIGLITVSYIIIHQFNEEYELPFVSSGIKTKNTDFKSK